MSCVGGHLTSLDELEIRFLPRITTIDLTHIRLRLVMSSFLLGCPSLTVVDLSCLSKLQRSKAIFLHVRI